MEARKNPLDRPHDEWEPSEGETTAALCLAALAVAAIILTSWLVTP